LHRRNQGQSYIPYLLIFPAFTAVFLIAAYSVFWLARMSLVDWVFGADWARARWGGLANYIWLLFDPNSLLWTSLKTTTIYVAATIVAEFLLGFGLALLLNEKIYGRSIYTAILIIPIVLMPSMVGMVGRLYFNYDGLVNFFVESIFHVKLNWYGPELALWAVILVDIWEWTPFFVLIMLAGLQSLPREPYEAAVVDGASGFQILRLVTIPMLAPIILTAIILRFMDVLRIFDVVFAMFGGGPGTATTTLPLLVYRLTMVARNVGRGSAVSIMLIILIVTLTYLLVKWFERTKYEG